MQKKVIKSILETYDLPIKNRKKIFKVVCQRVKSFSLEKFEDIYEDISFIVEKFYQTPYQERFFTRLDSPKYWDSDKKEHEFIAAPKFSLQEDYEESAPNSQLSIKEILEILEPFLDKPLFKLTQQLWFKENNLFNISKEFLIANTQKIQQRLEELIKKQEKNGNPLIPRRPILKIELSPLMVKIGRRNYNRNPLAFFREHSIHYGWITKRIELHKFDPGLLESLRRWEQLDLAIPNIIAPGSTTKISKEKEKEIIKNLKEYKSPTFVAKKLNVSRATVDYYGVKKYNIRKPHKKIGGPRYPKQMKKDIIECLRKCEKVSKVAEHYGVSRFTVTKYGREAGIHILSRGGNIENILKNKKTLAKNFLI